MTSDGCVFRVKPPFSNCLDVRGLIEELMKRSDIRFDSLHQFSYRVNRPNISFIHMYMHFKTGFTQTSINGLKESSIGVLNIVQAIVER